MPVWSPTLEPWVIAVYVEKIVTWRTNIMVHREQPEDKLGGWITVQVWVLTPQRLGAVGPETRLGHLVEVEGLMSRDGKSRM